MFIGLSKLGIALTIIFVISIVALFFELFYFLWRRHRATSNGGSNHLPRSLSSSSSSSKQQQLLYFFCCKTNLSRVEPNSAPSLDSTLPSPEDETEVIDVLKLHSMRGPSRVLFTIREEEREEVESADQRSLYSSAEKEKKEAKRMSLQECFEAGEEEPSLEVTVAVDDHLAVGDSTTPFSTPSASPLFFTPSATPTREIG